MMRELKFRAWDGNGFTYSDAYTDECLSENEALGKFFDDCYECEIFQYTCLKDKNGVEIYEGDIIQRDETLWIMEPIGEVHEGIYGIVVKNVKRGRCFHADDSVTTMGVVISNIYENPELLEAGE